MCVCVCVVRVCVCVCEREREREGERERDRERERETERERELNIIYNGLVEELYIHPAEQSNVKDANKACGPSASVRPTAMEH